MRIKKGDQVQVIAGKDKDKKGKVVRVLPAEEKVVVEKLNMVKRHMRPRREGEKGQIVDVSAPIHISNVMLVCPNCGKLTRVQYKISENDKTRVCKKCNKEF